MKGASAYFNIGIKKMRRLAEDNDREFALYFGNKFLICRPKFEEYLLSLMQKPSGDGGDSDEKK
ncbi:excisionase [[Clostridium] polysaccharolyticum]|nr:excisionase [[Clostridium] polysaccharolyticum]